MYHLNKHHNHQALLNQNIHLHNLDLRYHHYKHHNHHTQHLVDHPILVLYLNNYQHNLHLHLHHDLINRQNIRRNHLTQLHQNNHHYNLYLNYHHYKHHIHLKHHHQNIHLHNLYRCLLHDLMYHLNKHLSLIHI